MEKKNISPSQIVICFLKIFVINYKSFYNIIKVLYLYFKISDLVDCFVHDNAKI